MITLQEYLNQKYPTKEDKEKVKEISTEKINQERENQGIAEPLNIRELDLREYVSLEKMFINGNDFVASKAETSLVKLEVSGLTNLIEISCPSNLLTSVEFLKQLPNPEKLEELWIYNNDIQPTDIEIFSEFVNLRNLRIGTMEHKLKMDNRNKFYGSFQSWQNLTKLVHICIEATDINEGLEYLPADFARLIAKRAKLEQVGIECSPNGTNAKCSAIQDQLRPFNYDLEAWQLINKQYPNLTKQIQELSQKITETKTELETVKTNEADKTTKITRLESKLKLLEETKTKLKTELAQEQQQHNQTKANFQSQLRDLATILFPSNGDISNINFSDFKEQVEKVKEQNAKLQEKNQELKLALREEQKALTQEQKKTQQLQIELEREKNKNKFLSEQLENFSEAKIESSPYQK